MARIPSNYDDDFHRFLQKFPIRRTSNKELGERSFSKRRHAYGFSETRNRDLAASSVEDSKRTSSKLKEELAEVRTFKELENAFNTFKIRNQVTSRKLNTISLNIFLDKIKTLLDPEDVSEQIDRNQKFIREIFGELLKNLKRSNRYGNQEAAWTLSSTLSSLGFLRDRNLQKEILEALTLQIKSEEIFSAQQITACFDGLSNQDPNACKDLIQELEKKLETCTESFSARQVAMCLQGVKYHIASFSDHKKFMDRLIPSS